MFKPRESQKRILAYSGGRMGVAAVPGSGKTAVLSALAARLVATGLDSDQEVLIVTLVNSAVDNFGARIRQMLRTDYHLLPGMGYRVRTLHSLALDLVRERPGLVGLADDFAVADEAECTRLLNEVVQSSLRTHGELFGFYAKAEYASSALGRRKWQEDKAGAVAKAFIRQAKDRQWTPELLQSWLAERSEPLPLARFCLDVFADYQRSLAYRGKVDFDDLVSYAFTLLRLDEQYLARCRRRWPFVLEDEAQDSSRLQQDLLELLTGPGGNWVRVGDSNQAVYNTFTTADPRLLNEYLERDDVEAVEMAESGRSGRPIQTLANHLVDWALTGAPIQAAARAFRHQVIDPTPPDDPQANPPDEECQVTFFAKALAPEKEVRAVVESLARWVPENSQRTVAVLCPDNSRGEEFVKQLRDRGLNCIELLKRTSPARDTADALRGVLGCVADPDSPAKLSQAFRAWRWREINNVERKALIQAIAERLLSCARVEDYLYPRAGVDWFAAGGVDEETLLLSDFRDRVRRWQAAVGLPIDQLILTIVPDLFSEQVDIVRAYRFAVALRDISDANPGWTLKQLVAEIDQIASNERQLAGTLGEDSTLDPEKHRGEVVVATMHKAKGLEWDRVYLTALNNYDFPSGGELDSFKSEYWFVRDGLNLQAEALGQLDSLRPDGPDYREGVASAEARDDYVRERLRLLYVGITRAKRDLIATWNTGRKRTQTPAVAFTELRTFWEQTQPQAPGGGILEEPNGQLELGQGGGQPGVKGGDGAS